MSERPTQAGTSQPRRGVGRVVRPTAWLNGLTALLSAVGVLVVYLCTLAPSIVEGDGSELTTAAHLAGVPHPTGYPLYMLLSHGFLRVCQWGSVALRMNLLSALCAAGAVGLVCLLAIRLTGSRPGGAVAALLFGYSSTFWSQAVIAEVYAFHMLMVAGVMLSALRWDNAGTRASFFCTALLYGAAFAHHLSSVLLAPALLFLLLTSRHRAAVPRLLAPAAALMLLPLLLYAYLPWAALRNTPANWGDPSTPANMLAHITGRQYRDRMFSGGVGGFVSQLQAYAWSAPGGRPGYLPQQFSPWLLLLGTVGVAGLYRRHRRWIGFTALYAGSVIFWAANYKISDIEVYYLGATLVIACWIGVGAREVLLWVERRARRVVRTRSARIAVTLAGGLLAALIPGVGLAENWETNDRSDDWRTLAYARAALDAVPRNALLIGDGDGWYFPLLYTRFVEGRRPDVTLAGYYDLLLPVRSRRAAPLIAQGTLSGIPEPYLAPHGRRNWDTHLLARILEENVGKRPVCLLGEPVRMLRQPWMQELLAPYRGTQRTSIPLMELTRGAPPTPAADGNLLATSSPIEFLASGSRSVGTLLGARIIPLSNTPDDAPPWAELRYDWLVHDPALMQRAHVRVMFADAEGNYATFPDGSIEFQNNHWLGQGMQPGDRSLGRTVGERFRVYIPPGGWDRDSYLWVGLVVDDRFLPIKGRSGNFARVDLPALRVAMHGARLRSPAP